MSLPDIYVFFQLGHFCFRHDNQQGPVPEVILVDNGPRYPEESWNLIYLSFSLSVYLYIFPLSVLQSLFFISLPSFCFSICIFLFVYISIFASLLISIFLSIFITFSSLVPKTPSTYSTKVYTPKPKTQFTMTQLAHISGKSLWLQLKVRSPLLVYFWKRYSKFLQQISAMHSIHSPPYESATD